MKQMLGLFSILLLSSSVVAGTCRTSARPKSDWAGKGNNLLFAPWIERNQVFENMTVTDCIDASIKELNTPFALSDRAASPIKNVKYIFQEAEIKITGKVMNK